MGLFFNYLYLASHLNTENIHRDRQSLSLSIIGQTSCKKSSIHKGHGVRCTLFHKFFHPRSTRSSEEKGREITCNYQKCHNYLFKQYFIHIVYITLHIISTYKILQVKRKQKKALGA